MEFEIILKSDFDKVKKFVQDCLEIIYWNNEKDKVINGYKDFYIGQNIQVDFNDNDFGEYKLNAIIIDVLVEKEDNYGLLIIPEDRESFLPSMNVMLTKFGIDNLKVPKDGCFFAKHIGRERFILEMVEKNIGTQIGMQVVVSVPQIFKIHEDTFRRLLIYKKLALNTDLEIQKILE